MSPSSWAALPHNPAQMSSLRVYYVRHGQSVWNKEQGEAKEAGQSEAQVRAFGDLPRFTDAPLTAKGIGQALSLRERLFSSEADGTLSERLRCATSRKCTPPQVYVSNLRRAIDTGILAFRPLLEIKGGKQRWRKSSGSSGSSSASVTSLPALQESCWYADCNPLPRRADGSLEPAARSEDLKQQQQQQQQQQEGGGSEDVSSQVLRLQASALEAAASADEAKYLRAAYATALRLAPHSLYDDRRRLADGTSLTLTSQLEQGKFLVAMGPLAERMGDLLSAILPPPAAATSARASSSRASARAPPPDPTPPAAILAAHSRLIRELLFMFHSGRLSARVSRGGGSSSSKSSSSGSSAIEYSLRWDHSTSTNECLQVASDSFRLSNCGVVAFDLDVCEGGGSGGGEGGGGAADEACAVPTITLRNCRLEAGSHVVPRTSSPPSIGGPADTPPLSSLLGLALVFVSVFALKFYAGAKRVEQKQEQRQERELARGASSSGGGKPAGMKKKAPKVD